MAFAAVAHVSAGPPALAPCGDLPASIAALGPPGSLEAFGRAASGEVAIASQQVPGEAGRSVIHFAKGGEAVREVPLSGRVLGLAVVSDGSVAYAVVRVTDRKGALRSVSLVRLDLKSARASSDTPLPATARGLALSNGEADLLVACRDEIRTFRLPQLASGPLYRVLGDNVGVAPIPRSSRIVVAQRTRVVLADLADAQGRDGLRLSQETVTSVPLVTMMPPVGELGPVALSDGGAAWCIRVDAEPEAPPPPPPPTPIPTPVPTPVPTPMPEPSADATVPLAPPPPDPVPAEVAKLAPSPLPIEPPPAGIPAEPGTVSGRVDGPAVGDVDAIVFLGPDNVLKEFTRRTPDRDGRFSAAGLPTGSYRLVAAGKAGRVLICAPAFITIRVSSNGAVEAPVLKVLRAQ
jgi:hypothetical protein